MKKIFLLFVITMASISCSNAQKKEFSKDALKGTLTDSDNKEVTFKEVLKKYKGKTVVVEVWASWCGDCVGAMPKVKELQANNPDVAYVFISMDKTFDKWQDGIEKHQIKGDHYWVNDVDGMKGAFGKSIDLDWIPRYMVINKNGSIAIYRAIETDFDKINTTLKTL
ncbi:TlpA family protein disulfide reductase [Flavobacterium sp.]|jgi:thiol-disulfide isomerase/thioredoxin|uniref:TlpA family protein disulfide reductase n=1 Tax=Flavobacterium sp. TaxID=239 RepID=UPI0037BF69D7